MLLTEKDLHPHLQARMVQRGITFEEIQITLNEGCDAADAKANTFGKVKVFQYEAEWEGKFYKEKEVTVYYRQKTVGMVLLTVKARYGKGFSRSI